MRMSFEDGRDDSYGSFETLTVNRDAAIELLRLARHASRASMPMPSSASASSCSPSWSTPRRIPTASPPGPGCASAFPGHPYGRPPEGTVDSAEGDQSRGSRSLPQARLRPRHASKSLSSATSTPRRWAGCWTRCSASCRPSRHSRRCRRRPRRKPVRHEGHRDGRAAVGRRFRPACASCATTRISFRRS